MSVWTVGIGISSLRCVDSDLDWRSLCYFGRSGFKFRIRLVLYVAVVVTEMDILSDHIKQFLAVRDYLLRLRQNVPPVRSAQALDWRLFTSQTYTRKIRSHNLQLPHTDCYITWRVTPAGPFTARDTGPGGNWVEVLRYCVKLILRRNVRSSNVLSWSPKETSRFSCFPG